MTTYMAVKALQLAFGFLLLLLPVSSSAERVQTIGWDDLIPDQYGETSPLATLSEKELDEVEWIIYLRQNLPKTITPMEQKLYDEMITGMPKLKNKGIDVDKIIAERKKMAVALNTKLDGKRVRLAGYLLPLDLSGKKVKDFLLVPYVGACIHVPPPPPNQIVHGTPPQAMKFKAKEIFKPVWATGRLQAKSLSKELYLGDGSGMINIGYVMQVESIRPYKK